MSSGSEYSDAVVASFLEKVDKEIAARVDARLAGTPRTTPTLPGSRSTLLKGIAIGIAISGVSIFLARGIPTKHTPPVDRLHPPGGGVRRWRILGRTAPGEPQGWAAAGSPRRRLRLLPAADVRS